MPNTALSQLVEVRLGRPLEPFVRSRLAEGLGWRRISDDLWKVSGHRVSHETLRSWFATDVAA